VGKDGVRSERINKQEGFHLDDIVDLHKRVGVANGAAVVSDDERDLLLAHLLLLHTNQFILLFLVTDSMKGVSNSFKQKINL
jgi:hypothetical protein